MWVEILPDSTPLVLLIMICDLRLEDDAVSSKPPDSVRHYTDVKRWCLGGSGGGGVFNIIRASKPHYMKK